MPCLAGGGGLRLRFPLSWLHSALPWRPEPQRLRSARLCNHASRSRVCMSESEGGGSHSGLWQARRGEGASRRRQRRRWRDVDVDDVARTEREEGQPGQAGWGSLVVWCGAVRCSVVWISAAQAGAVNVVRCSAVQSTVQVSSGEFGRMVEKHDRPMRLPNCGMDLQKYFGAAYDAL
jgi:hypothetical protein